MNLPDLNPFWLAAAGLALAGLGLALWGWRLRRRRPPPVETPDLTLDVSRLEERGPPASGPQLQFYGTPVRLAVVVVAPGGRGGGLPPPEVLPGLMEQLVPGMTEVIAAHQPLIRRWPPQLSSQGFAQAFFNHVALPGTRGKGTPWCSLAGKLSVGARTFLVGLVFCAGGATTLSQMTVQHEGQWLDILRIRSA